MAHQAQFSVGAVVFVPDNEAAYLPKRVVECKGLGAATQLTVGPVSGNGGGCRPALAGGRGRHGQVHQPDRGRAAPQPAHPVQPQLHLLRRRRNPHLGEPVQAAAGRLHGRGAGAVPGESAQPERAARRNGGGVRAARARRSAPAAPPCRALAKPYPLLPCGIVTILPSCIASPSSPLSQRADAKSLPELPPHVYVLSETAFRGMLHEQKQQAILISGESGAGKTEAAKACIKYIVARSSSAHSAPSNAQFIETCILEANPILEAFGNAKTLRNNNSSRFGKWTEIHFDATGQ
eukprot:scaffold12822_cov112-Isochrysis_galbana.AAC.5